MKKEQSKKHFDRDIIKLMVAGALALCICAVICVLLILELQVRYTSTAFEQVDSQAKIGSKAISSSLSKSLAVVNMNATQLEQSGGLSLDAINKVLEECARQENFRKEYFINTIGTVYNTERAKLKVDMDEYARYFDQNAEDAYVKAIKTASGEDYVLVISPVRTDGTVRGYIIGANQAESLLLNVESAYLNGTTFNYLADKEGNVIASTSTRGIDNVGNLFEFMLTNSKNPKKMEHLLTAVKENVKKGEPGQIHADLERNTSYIYYVPIQGTDWYFLSCIYEDTIKDAIGPVVFRTALGCGLIILTMVIFVTTIVRRIRRDQNKIEELAYVDILTGARNMNYFLKRTAELLEENRDLPYIIVCFDIVNFRYLNEGYGHEKADSILTAMVNAAKDSFSYNETFARISADKFVCLAIDDGREQARRKFIEDKVNRYANRIAINYPIHFKSGTYVVVDYTEDIPRMIDKADLARKTISDESKDMHVYYEESLMEETRKREYIESKMVDALGKGEFVPYLQPKWDMEKNCIVGAEALVRWIKSDGTIIYPNDFIPIFERNGFVEKIDFYMLEEICKYIRRIMDEGKIVYPVSINQSRYLLHSREYVKNVQEILLKYEIPSDYIELELTETVFFLEREHMINVMKKLKDINVMLSIDDFGSGFSSLNLLKDIPFNVLKIDRGFLDETATSEASMWILRKIIEMADGLNVNVLCEGVETEEQAIMLQSIGCKIAQGYLFAKPMPLHTFEEKYNL